MRGDILIDGIPLAEFGIKNFHEQIGAVLQDDSLFAGTLTDNIALYDHAPDVIRLKASTSMAELTDDIATMPMGYDTLIGDMGSTLSGGQRQRLLLSRALYRRPKLLVMDEGTSHLDRPESVRSTPPSARWISQGSSSLSAEKPSTPHVAFSSWKPVSPARRKESISRNHNSSARRSHASWPRRRDRCWKSPLPPTASRAF
ncbi:ATP-binding cassette domain-containing protein [uncultured Sphingomonas sp.]|uniref:ATP-binding cassette domain-containing protein n=1 Tax=uncultured Sphingomonas sp. TaxID=158754 RepID=UPI0035CABF5E